MSEPRPKPATRAQTQQAETQQAETQQAGPVLLIVRDGWGQNPHPEQNACNAIHLAATPVADALTARWPHTLIRTSGEAVGLPKGTMGNSEVGHQNIGAGRVVDQELRRIDRSIESGAFATLPALLGAFAHIAKTGGHLHLLGLLSDGQVHSHIEHLFALIDLAAQQGLAAERLLLHAISDGRDTSPQSGLGFVAATEDKLVAAGVGRIATLCGRYWAMDRDHRWQRVALAYRLLTGRGAGAAPATAKSAAEAMRAYYAAPSDQSRTGDEFITPTRIATRASTATPVDIDGCIQDGDAVIFFNFRGDRPREISKAFVLPDDAWAKIEKGGFDRGRPLENLYFCTMTGYESSLPVDAIAFERPAKMPNILGQVVSAAGRSQLRSAETEKYPHVTFFFNDYRDPPFPGETRLLLPSPKEVSTYDQKPEMAAEELCAAVLERLAAADCEALMVINFANADMVGHTGKLPAIIQAVETVDRCVGRIVEAALARGGRLLITADHGNAEQTWDAENDCPHTAHTTYDVPLILAGAGCEDQRLRAGGRLADIAPTLLRLLGLEVPEEMTGHCLLGHCLLNDCLLDS